MARGRSQMPPPPNKAALVEENPEMNEAPVDDLDGLPELDAASEAEPIEPPPLPKPVSRRKIKVVANRQGYIFCERKNVGDKFEVLESQLGSWMDCEDPVEQKKHQMRVEEKRKRANRRAIAEQARETSAVE